MDLMSIRRGLMAQMAGNVWHMKHFTVDVACANALQLANVLNSQLPSGYTFAFIVNDNQDWSTYADKQFVYALAPQGALFAFARYTLSSGALSTVGSWGTGTSVLTTIGDKYTMIYQ